MITGITKRGEYSNNSMVKKHYTQMSKKEIQTLCNLYNDIDVEDIILSKHLHDKLEKELEDAEDIFYFTNMLIYNSELIEFNTGKDGKDSRILIRFKEKFRGKLDGIVTDVALCVVFSLKNKSFVTVYLNDYYDNHETLRKEQYTKNFNIIEHLKKGGLL